jgi:membrane protein DedA with SNARE-associated domain/uncharacterized tellurite resistance protein B-like protein
VTWLGQLPALTVYLVLAVATGVETIFPPAPSDIVVALAAFLSRRGTTTPVGVFAAAWLASVTGAVIVYGLARRYGRRFFAGPVGRRLLPPQAVAAMEREYLRFGIAGIFVTRLLPGFRSFVAPFAGLAGLHPVKALLPMALASGVWYAGLVWVGARLGQSWDAINRIIAHLNQTLTIFAALVFGLGIIQILRNRRSARRDRLWDAVHRAFRDDPAGEREAREDPATLAAATLLLEVAHADRQLGQEEVRLIESQLRKRWNLGVADRGTSSAALSAVPPDTDQFRGQIAERYDRPARVDLLRRLRRVATSNETLSVHQDRLLRRASELLGLDDTEIAEAGGAEKS